MARREQSSSNLGVTSEIALAVSTVMNSDAVQKMIKVQASAAAANALQESVTNAKKSLTQHVDGAVIEAIHALKKRAYEGVDTAVAESKSQIQTIAKNKAAEEVQALIANHPIMIGYLQQHDANLAIVLQKQYESTQAALEQKYREHLAKIVQEDQYRVINDALVKELAARYDAAFRKLEADYKVEHERQALATGTAVQGMISKLSEKAKAVESAHSSLTALQARIAEQNVTINKLKWVAWIAIVLGMTSTIAHALRT